VDWSIIWRIAGKHLFARKKQTLVAALGVTFGIGTFIILVSFMTGLNGLLDGLILNRTPHIHLFNEIRPSETQPVDLSAPYQNGFNVVHSIKPKESLKRVHNALPIMHYLEQLPEVRGVTPQVLAQVFYISGSIELNGIVYGVDILSEERLFSMSDYIVEGSARALKNNQNGILLGAGIAAKMSAKVGDKIQISTVGGGIFPLQIVGIFQSGLAEIDDRQSYVNLATAQQIQGESRDYITDINVKLHDMEGAGAMAARLQRQFGIRAVDIKSANAQFETGTSIRNLITYAVSIALLTVAGFGIYNILNMVIYEKMNDIAILKATGFSGRDVKWIFISQAMFIGLVGGVIGLGLGYVVSVLIDRAPFETDALPTIKTFPVNFNPAYYGIGMMFAMVSTFVAGYLPAKRAEKIDPVEILRGQ
jgi:lipoprotein-releasing system permease protein